MSLTAKHLAGVVSAGVKGRGPCANRRATAVRCEAASTGNNTQYVRKHILDLAAYTPIVPFEVLSGK